MIIWLVLSLIVGWLIWLTYWVLTQAGAMVDLDDRHDLTTDRVGRLEGKGRAGQ